MFNTDIHNQIKQKKKNQKTKENHDDIKSNNKATNYNQEWDFTENVYDKRSCE